MIPLFSLSRISLWCALLVAAVALAAPPVQAQDTGTLAGRVLDGVTQEGLVGANVVLEDTQRGTSADAEGAFQLTGIPTGTYTARVSFIGYQPVTQSVTIRSGQTTLLNVSLEASTFLGDEIVVTGSKRPEKLLDAPVQVEAISADELATTGGGTFLAALGNLKGVDFVDVGINGQGISARGFNNHFNTRMLSMVDGRLATLPGTGLPQGNFLPTSQLDVKSIEVVVGPASALYGPNAHTGVVNVITKDPWDQSGVALDLRGGQNDLLDVNTRIAGTVGEQFGWKVTGQYMTATDYAPPIGGPNATMADSTHYFGTPYHESQIVEDYDVRSLRTEGGVYVRFLDDWQLQATAGFSENDNFGLTNNGRNRILGWQVNYQNLQLSSDHWYAQVTRTANDAGDTYQINATAQAAGAQGSLNNLQSLREANAFTDKGSLLDSEVQYRNSFGSLDLTAGAQLRQYKPDSEGTFLADVDGNDIDASEVGGYTQIDYRFLDDRLRLNAAARLDDHSDYGTQFSPKAALVATVVQNHNVRIGYNRAFKSPTVLESNLFLSFPGLGNVFLGNIDGYTVRSGPTAGSPVATQVSPLEPEQVNSLEIGYKGMFGSSLYVDAVFYNSWYENFISPLTQVANPAAGTFAFNDAGDLVAGNGFLWTYFNFGEATVRGFDFGLNAYVNEHLNLTGNLSLIDLADFTAEEGRPELLLNVPSTKLKGSVTVRDLGVDNWFTSLTGRWQSAYKFGAGYWQSQTFYNDGEVPSRFVANLTAGYKLPAYGVSVTASVSNLFNNEGVDVLGSPVRDRLIWIGATYRFDGLNL